MITYTAKQLATAKESWDFWKGADLDDVHAATMLGDEDGETSFIYPAINGHHTACGIAQWSNDRRNTILLHTKIDVDTASHPQQLKALKWEITMGPYKHMWNLFMSTTTIMDATRIIVAKYERSGEQARDIARRSILAAHWKGQFGEQK